MRYFRKTCFLKIRELAGQHVQIRKHVFQDTCDHVSGYVPRRSAFYAQHFYTILYGLLIFCMGGQDVRGQYAPTNTSPEYVRQYAEQYHSRIRGQYAIRSDTRIFKLDTQNEPLRAAMAGTSGKDGPRRPLCNGTPQLLRTLTTVLQGFSVLEICLS